MSFAHRPVSELGFAQFTISFFGYSVGLASPARASGRGFAPSTSHFCLGASPSTPWRGVEG